MKPIEQAIISSVLTEDEKIDCLYRGSDNYNPSLLSKAARTKTVKQVAWGIYEEVRRCADSNDAPRSDYDAAWCEAVEFVLERLDGEFQRLNIEKPKE